MVEKAVFGGPIPESDYGDLIGDVSNNADIIVSFNAPRLPVHNQIGHFVRIGHIVTGLRIGSGAIRPKN